MKRMFSVVAAAAALLCLSANHRQEANVTEIQAAVCSALDSLGLKNIPPTDGSVGGPQHYAVTETAIRKLQGLQQSGKRLVVYSDGRIGAQ
jgi:hypothetical protein